MLGLLHYSPVPRRLVTVCTALRTWLPLAVLVIFCAGIVSNWMVRADGPTLEWLQMQAANQAQRMNDIQVSSDAQASAMRERLKATEVLLQEHGRKLDDIAATERWIAFGILGLLGTQLFRRTWPGIPPSDSGAIITLGSRKD